MTNTVHGPAVRDRALHLVSSGMSVLQASLVVGVSDSQITRWWVKAGGMKLMMSRAGGIAVDVATAGGSGGVGHRLNLDERIAIHSGRLNGLSYAAIGAQIGRDKSVVWREVNRNCNPGGEYHAGIATVRANQRAHRPKGFKLVDNPGLCSRIEDGRRLEPEADRADPVPGFRR